MLVDELPKQPTDEFGYGMQYDPKVMAQGEYLSTVDLSALEADGTTDISATFLASIVGTIPRDTAASGSTKEVVGSKDLAAAGFKVGDWFVNETQGWRALIKRIKKTTIANDTLVFEEQSNTAVVADVFSAMKGIASLQAGTDGDRNKVTFKATTNLGQVFEDEIIVNVIEY